MSSVGQFVAVGGAILTVVAKAGATFTILFPAGTTRIDTVDDSGAVSGWTGDYASRVYTLTGVSGGEFVINWTVGPTTGPNQNPGQGMVIEPLAPILYLPGAHGQTPITVAPAKPAASSPAAAAGAVALGASALVLAGVGVAWSRGLLRF